MSEIPIEGKLKPLLVGGKVADAVDLEVDASGFNGNLTTSDNNLQLVSQALDDLTISGMGGSGYIFLNFGSNNRPYSRSSLTSFTRIVTSLPITNDEIQITGGQANIYANSALISNMYLRIEDNSDGTIYINDTYTATTDEENIEDFGAFVNPIPGGATLQLDLGISIASSSSLQVRCGSIRLDFDYR